MLIDLPCFHSSSPCLLRRIWWSTHSPHLSSPPLSVQRHPLWPPPSRPIHHHFPPPPRCSVMPPLPSPWPSLTIHAPRPPQPSLQPPSCVLLPGQSELTRDQFSSHRTNDNTRVWVQGRQLCHQDRRIQTYNLFNLTDPSRLYRALTFSPSLVFILRVKLIYCNRPPTWSQSEERVKSSLRSWRTREKKCSLKRRCFWPHLEQQKQGVTLLKSRHSHFHTSFHPCVQLKAK